MERVERTEGNVDEGRRERKKERKRAVGGLFNAQWQDEAPSGGEMDRSGALSWERK